jgi:hypothetical protein
LLFILCLKINLKTDPRKYEKNTLYKIALHCSTTDGKLIEEHHGSATANSAGLNRSLLLRLLNEAAHEKRTKTPTTFLSR